MQQFVAQEPIQHTLRRYHKLPFWLWPLSLTLF